MSNWLSDLAISQLEFWALVAFLVLAAAVACGTAEDYWLRKWKGKK